MPEPSEQIYDTVIIGGGAAGLSAAIYAGRYLMRTLVLEGGEAGGDTAVAWIVENYPGIPKIDGYELIQAMRRQAGSFGVSFSGDRAETISAQEHCFTLRGSSGSEYFGKTLILAYGEKRRQLGLKREAELKGKGVSYCVTCDGPLYKGKTIAIVGGGDASAKGAVLASRYAEQIYFITREAAVRAEPVNQAQFEQLPNVTVITETEVRGLLGDDRLTGIALSRPWQGQAQLTVDGLFIEIGEEPAPELARALGVQLDDHGFVEVDPMMRTSVDGVYAAGDLVNETGTFKQIIVGAAQGALAATSAYRDLGLHGGQACRVHAVPGGQASPAPAQAGSAG